MKKIARLLNSLLGRLGLRVVRRDAFDRLHARARGTGSTRKEAGESAVADVLKKYALAGLLSRFREKDASFLSCFDEELVDDSQRKFLLILLIEGLDGTDAGIAAVELERVLDKYPDEEAAMALARWWYQRGEIGSAMRVLRTCSRGEKVSKLLKSYSDEWMLAQTGPELVPVVSAPRADVSPGSIYYLLHNCFPFHGGGYATRAHGLLAALNQQLNSPVIGMARLGYPYDRTSAKSAPEVEEIKGVRYEFMPDKHFNLNKLTLSEYFDAYEKALSERLKNRAPRLIHAASFFHNGIAAARVARRLGIPFVYEIRGLDEFAQVSRNREWEGSDRHRMFRRLEMDVAREADHVFAITHRLKQFLVEQGVDESRISVLSNHVDAASFGGSVASKANVALPAGYEADKDVLLGYIGSFVDYEGLDLLVKAVAGLRQKGRRVCALIVGDGVESARVRQKVAELGMEKYISLPGRIDFSRVAAVYELVDIVVYPRQPWLICEVISPIKPFEAMARGKCVLASDVAALREIVQPEGRQLGELFKAGDTASMMDAIERLADDRDRRSELGRAAAEWTWENKTWESGARHVKTVYESLLGVTL